MSIEGRLIKLWCAYMTAVRMWAEMENMQHVLLSGKNKVRFASIFFSFCTFIYFFFPNSIHILILWSLNQGNLGNGIMGQRNVIFLNIKTTNHTEDDKFPWHNISTLWPVRILPPVSKSSFSDVCFGTPWTSVLQLSVS